MAKEFRALFLEALSMVGMATEKATGEMFTIEANDGKSVSLVSLKDKKKKSVPIKTFTTDYLDNSGAKR